MTTLTPGCFYWVRMVVVDERAKDPKWMPAKYTGKSADTHAREETRGDQTVLVAYSPDTWDFIGFRSDDGHHFVDVVQVGPQICLSDSPLDHGGPDTVTVYNMGRA